MEKQLHTKSDRNILQRILEENNVTDPENPIYKAEDGDYCFRNDADQVFGTSILDNSESESRNEEEKEIDGENVNWNRRKQNDISDCVNIQNNGNKIGSTHVKARGSGVRMRMERKFSDSSIQNVKHPNENEERHKRGSDSTMHYGENHTPHPHAQLQRRKSHAGFGQDFHNFQRYPTWSHGNREREKNELKSKVEELEEYRGKYEDEKKITQSLQVKIDRLLQNQSDAGQKLFKSNELVEKLRTDNKKKVEQIEKLQRDIRYMEDRLRNLEIRASEVEKAELILESTKSNLESTVLEVRGKEHEIRKLTSMYDDVCKQRDQANEKIKELEERNLDLKYQVRHELMKNESIEKNLETIPRLKDEISDRGKEIENLRSEMEDKNALLMAARKAVREYKEQNREMEQKVCESDAMRDELEMTQGEVLTLKQLIQGKNSLVIQKSKALDVAKDVINTMQLSTDPHQIEKIVGLLERIGSQPSTSTSGSVCSSSIEFDTRPPTHFSYNSYSRQRNSDSTNQYGIDVNRNPYHGDSAKRPLSGGHFVEIAWKEKDNSYEETRPKTAIVHPVKRSQSFKENHHQRGQLTLLKRSESHKGQGERKSDATSPTFEYTIGLIEECQNNNNDTSKPKKSASLPVSSRTNSAFSPRSRSRSTQSLSEESCFSSSENTDSDDKTFEVVEKLSNLTYKEKEGILEHFINVGDRILVTVSQKPPKYGRKMPGKPKTYTGIIKYRGNLDKKGYDPRVFIGVRLDENAGDTDGVLKGKRYMYTPSDQGKFFKLLDVNSILDVKSGRYRSVTSILSQHFLKKMKSSKR
ncbi:hypothetical protein FSP39_007626 [Pinctada imbricata]|uniref:CAP-Gly domain-containing protein n=1 Tax=Pinctada imbricata TaxID=66713 RepID=A0AA89BLP0_PINIB|nr:hypothetical protein FSP39_007626 [Pinctada imbricata]